MAEKEELKPCPLGECDGSGEVSEDETTPEGHVARGTLTKKCLCKLKDPDDYDETD